MSRRCVVTLSIAEARALWWLADAACPDLGDDGADPVGDLSYMAPATRAAAARAKQKLMRSIPRPPLR